MHLGSLDTDNYGRVKQLMGVMSHDDLLGDAMPSYPKCWSKLLAS